MEKWTKRAVNLVTSIAFGGTDRNTVIPYYPQKIQINGEEVQTIPRSIPEAHGISSKRIYNLLCELEGERRSNVHNVLIVKDGVVISECSRPGYGVNHWHLSHSMTKSVIGMAIGLLYDDGLVTPETRLVDIFPEIPFKDKRFSYITVEHLLTMTTGILFGEAGSVTESEWSAAFFSSTMMYAPGTEFYYNSMNSYILARIVAELSGKSVIDYVSERIFEPLEITNYFWEVGPENVEKGGWGLYLSAESWAKIGIMFMGGGVYNGKRILSDRWVKMSSETHALTHAVNVDFNYGYQLWVAKESSQLLFNGMLGQDVWMCPENNIVVVIQSGNNELFQDSPSLEIIRRHLGGKIDDPISFKDSDVLHMKEKSFFAARVWARPLEKHRGLFYFLGLKNKSPFDERWNSLLGNYRLPENNCGILPLFVRAMQNNLETSIDSVTFSREGDGLYLTVNERDEIHKIEVGLYEYKSAVVDFRGEKYIIKALGEAEEEPDDSYAFRIELVYPELPNTLMLRFKKTLCDRVGISVKEIPNSGVVDAMVTRLADSHSSVQLLMSTLDSRFGEEVIHERIEATFAPKFVAADTSFEGFEAIIAEEEAIARDDSALVKTIKSVVNKYLKLDDDREDERPESKIKSIISGIADKLKRKGGK